MRDKEIERNRLKIPGIFIKSSTNDDHFDSACTLGVIAQGLKVVAKGEDDTWDDTIKNLSIALDVPLKELFKVEMIHDALAGKWTKKKVHRKAYQYLITKHGFPL